MREVERSLAQTKTQVRVRAVTDAVIRRDIEIEFLWEKVRELEREVKRRDLT